MRREEAGVFTALKNHGHASFDELLSDLNRGYVTLSSDVGRVLAELTEHIDKDNLGICPVAVVTLGADGWNTVARAHGTS